MAVRRLVDPDRLRSAFRFTEPSKAAVVPPRFARLAYLAFPAFLRRTEWAQSADRADLPPVLPAPGLGQLGTAAVKLRRLPLQKRAKLKRVPALVAKRKRLAPIVR